MITYKRCSEVGMKSVFHAFEIGFSDYIIKIQMPEEAFVSRFFGPEGNSISESFIALDGDKPIGVVLSGVRSYEGTKTIRCGTLAVAPEYRGVGVSQKLMELHKIEAKQQGCKQLFLEVIANNDRAINFYKKIGYRKVYDLSYFSLNDSSTLKENNKIEVNIKKSSFDELRLVRDKIKDIHINWQNDIEYIENSKGQIVLGAYIKDKIAGIVSMNENSKLNFIWVENGLRHNGIGTSLIINSLLELKINKVSVGFPNNASVEGFITHLGFKREEISQYEMYHTL